MPAEPCREDLDAAAGARALAWRRAATLAVSIWGLAALGLLITTVVVWWIGRTDRPGSNPLDLWYRWDTEHYITIAESGYDPATENPAFFPLYPMLMRILDPVLPGDMLATAVIVSNLAAIVALTLLYRLTDDLLGEDVARRTATYLMCFPVGFFILAPYNESLFLAVSLGALYAMRRASWVVAGVLGGLASATRQAGILLVLAFVIEYLRHRRLSEVRFDVLAAGLIPVGVSAFAGYCWVAFGDPLKFIHAQTFWRDEPTFFWVGMQRAALFAFDAARRGSPMQVDVVFNVIDLTAVVFAVVLMLASTVGPRRLADEARYLIAFAWAGLLAILVNPLDRIVPLHGAPRYILELVPVFLVLARLGAHARINRFYVALAVTGQLVCTVWWLQGRWVA